MVDRVVDKLVKFGGDMFPTIPLGPLQFPVKPFMLLVSLYVFLWLGEKEARRLGLKGEKVWDAGFYSIIAGVVCGRAAHVLLNWHSYSGNWGQVFSLNTNTFVTAPALIGALLTWIVYARFNGMPLLTLADALSPGTALAWALASFGDLANGDAYGSPTSLPWGIRLWGAKRHPTQLYYLLGAVLLFSILWALRKRSAKGRQFLVLLGGAGAILLLVGAFRANPSTIVGGIRTEQVIGLVMLIGAMGLDMAGCCRRSTTADEAPES
jgi:phosphatidylglycerol:prolipoprotein diacylglycerol transferase